MIRGKNGAWICGALAAMLVATAVLAEKAAVPAQPSVPAGAYKIDRSHASLLFKVSHLGFSNYTARFKKFDADLQFDPRNIAVSRVTVRVDTASLETDFPDPLTTDFNKQLRGVEWLDAAAHPQMIFESKRVMPMEQQTFRIEGTLTLRGMTRPMTLLARYNGGYPGQPLDPHARVGFSAHGHLKRSEFGMTVGIPAPGTTMGVADDVEVIIEAEFSGPPLAKR